MQVALSTVLTRLPDLRLAVPEDEVPWKVGMLMRGPTALPVSW
jgi:cytochrome P450